MEGYLPKDRSESGSQASGATAGWGGCVPLGVSPARLTPGFPWVWAGRAGEMGA